MIYVIYRKFDVTHCDLFHSIPTAMAFLNAQEQTFEQISEFIAVGVYNQTTNHLYCSDTHALERGRTRHLVDILKYFFGEKFDQYGLVISTGKHFDEMGEMIEEVEAKIVSALRAGN